MDIINEINAYMQGKLPDLYADTIYVDYLPIEPSDGIMSLQDPGGTEQRYMDKTRSGVFNFSYIARSTDRVKANSALVDIETVLDLPEFTEITGILEVKIEVTTTAHFVSKTEKDEFLYTNSFQLEYHTEV